MGRIGRRKRQFVIKRRRRKQKKVKKLKESWEKASSKEEKERLKEKIAKISPYYSLNSLEKGQSLKRNL